MPDSSETFRFGDFELDVPAYGLRRRGVQVKLERQPMDLLILLVERRQQLVPRSDIVDRLWGKDVFIDVETGINTAIRKIRHVLDDAPETPAFVETISGKGYRFIAPVDVISGERTSHSPTPYPLSPAASPVAIPEHRSNPAAATEVPMSRSERWHLRWVGAAAMGIATLALAGLWFFRPARATTGPVPAMRVVQLTSLRGYEFGRSLSGWPAGAVRVGWRTAIQPRHIRPAGRLIQSSSVDDGSRRRCCPVLVVGTAGRSRTFVVELDPFSGYLRVMSSLGDSDSAGRRLPCPGARPLGLRTVAILWRAGRPRTDAANPANGLYLIPVQGGEPRILTRPPAPGVDRTPTFSPDGHRLAYISCEGPSIGGTACHLNVVDVDAGFVPVGSPRQVPHVPRTSILGLAWSGDGKSLIFGAADLTFPILVACWSRRWPSSGAHRDRGGQCGVPFDHRGR